MKDSESAILLFFASFLLVSESLYVNSDSVQETFVECLHSRSQPSKPISHAIITPDNSSFSSTLLEYARNQLFTTANNRKPLVIVAAMDKSHIQAAVLCSKAADLEMRIRSGGHDYEGLSYVSSVPFIILDMFNLRSIDINMKDETAWVQSGATVGELYYRIAEKSSVHGFPAGVCPTLGVGGHFTGGGYGNMMRKFGLSVDNIVDAEIVDVNGNVLDRKGMGEDLFWAIRGGGASSFCVVVSWKIKLVPVPKKVTVFRVEKTMEEGAVDLVVKWQQIADKVDENLFLRLFLSPLTGTKKTVKAAFIAMFLGESNTLLSVMNTSFPELGLQQKNCTEMSWIESVLSWSNYPQGTSKDVLLNRKSKSLYFLKRSSDYVQQPIPKTGIELIFKLIIEFDELGMVWNPYGGEMSKISEMATPFPHRAGNIFKIQHSTSWKEADNNIIDKHLDQIRKLYDAMTPFVSKNPREAFLNYRDIDIGRNLHGTYDEGKVYGIKYFKSNFDRLVQIKNKVDPDNFFRNEQSIPTSGRHS